MNNTANKKADEVQKQTRTPAKARVLYFTSVRSRVEEGSAKLAEWADRFKADPMYALAWADDTYRVAAEVAVAKMILTWAELDAGTAFAVTMDRLTAKLAYEVRYAAGRRASSTSQASNLADDCKRVALTEALERLEGFAPTGGWEGV